VLARVSMQPGIGSETLRGWMKRADIDDGLRPGVASDERQHLLLALEPETGALRRADGCHAPLLSSHVFQDHVMLPAVSEVAYIDEAIPGFVSQLVQAEARLVNGGGTARGMLLIDAKRSAGKARHYQVGSADPR
jgi:hypothetical protein